MRPSLFHGTERTGTDRNTSLFHGMERTVQIARWRKRRTSVLRCAYEYEVSSEELNDNNCLSCTYHDFTHLRS